MRQYRPTFGYPYRVKPRRPAAYAECGHGLALPGDGEHVGGRYLCPGCAAKAREAARVARIAAEAAGQQTLGELPELPAAELELPAPTRRPAQASLFDE